MKYITNTLINIKVFILNHLVHALHTLEKEPCVVIHREGCADEIVKMPKFAGNSRQRRVARRKFLRHSSTVTLFAPLSDNPSLSPSNEWDKVEIF